MIKHAQKSGNRAHTVLDTESTPFKSQRSPTNAGASSYRNCNVSPSPVPATAAPVTRWDRNHSLAANINII